MGIVNSERVFRVFDTEDSISDTGTIHSEKFKGDIEFKNVSFGYDDDEYVLKDISFEVKEGQTVAFVGATGAGKSSIINLLSRFYEYQKGEILIDGTEIRKYSLDSIRQNIAVVLQDVFLFSDTILHNVRIGDESISREKVIEAAKIVGAHEFISKLPGTYDYDVKERGGMLSVGQRQLLAFIRAYVYNPNILVLDEATSSVDTESEQLIQKAIDKLTEGRTSIVIAHRLSTIQKADQIIVLDKGRIIERGSHQELLEKEGHYRKLYELQFKD
jgi:ATP-binding cassette subfamily B protein